jgi:sporulation protein YlmC with PRC-barrel domain
MKQRLLFSVAVVAGLAVASVSAFGADPTSNKGENAPSAAPAAQTKADLIGDKVVDSKGEQVGTVKDIRTNANGTATAVVVNTGTKDVAVPAGEIVIASNDTLKTAKSASEVKKLPAEPAGNAPSASPATTPDPSSAPDAGGKAPY